MPGAERGTAGRHIAETHKRGSQGSPFAPIKATAEALVPSNALNYTTVDVRITTH